MRVNLRRRIAFVAVLVIAIGTAAGPILVAMNARRTSRAQKATVSPIAVAADPPVDAANGGRKAA